MHAAVKADTEDGNAALAGCAAGRQGGRRAAVLLRHANPTDVHHDICSDKAFPQRSRCTFPIGRRGPAHQASRTSIRIVLNYVKNRHAQMAVLPQVALRLAATVDDLPQLEQALSEMEPNRTERTTVTSTYYDTAAGRLDRVGLTLQVQKQNGRYKQIVTTAELKE